MAGKIGRVIVRSDKSRPTAPSHLDLYGLMDNTSTNLLRPLLNAELAVGRKNFILDFGGISGIWVCEEMLFEIIQLGRLVHEVGGKVFLVKAPHTMVEKLNGMGIRASLFDDLFSVVDEESIAVTAIKSVRTPNGGEAA